MTYGALDCGPTLASADPVAPVDTAWPRSMRWLWPLAHGLVSALFTAGLWAAGYPRWRTALVGALLLGNWLRNMVFKHLVLAVNRSEKPKACTLSSTAAWLMGIASLFVVIGLSGGLRSPFLIAMMGPLSGMLVYFGWSRETKAALRVVAVGFFALVVLPNEWLGPTVQSPWFARLAGLTLFSAIFLHSTYLVAMTRALRESLGRTDRARERLAQEAMARARELEQLSAQLSHELKNPLGAIKALVQLSRRDACDDASRERLGVAENEIERMHSIIQEYLSFSRPLDRLRREPVALGALADEVLELLGAQAGNARVDLRRSGDADVEVDPRRVREAVFNLVANAIDATPPGGTVQVSIARRDGVAELQVVDSGRGMPREVLERVGTPFFTTREQGTGLGVAMARAAFSQHGGSLEYRSVEGRGTTVTGIIPVDRRATLGAPAAG